MLLVEKLLGSSSAAAANPYIEDVFSTYLYTGTGATQAISNNIALGNGATTAGWIASSVDDVYADKSKSIYSTTIDTSGNIYVVGSYSKSTTYFNLYVAKLDSAGVVQWQRSIGDTGLAQGYAVAVDSSGNVYACGTSAAIATGLNAFIVKYNASGTLQWQRKLGNNGGQVAYGLALDSSANVYICGDGGIIGSDYYFLTAKYNTSGTLQWQRKIAATTSGNQISAYAIAVDASGNAYVTGQETVSAGVYNTITVKYNTSGTLQWQKRLNSSRGNSGRGIALDSTGSNVYVSGFSDNVTTGNDTMLVKYNSSGTLQWQRRAYGASASTDSLYGICVDTSDNVYVAGQTGSSAISLLLMKYNSSGTLQFQKSLRDNTANTYAYSIATNSTDSLFLGGYKRDTSTLYFNSVLAKVAIDGTANGGYGDYTYSTATLTDVADTLTDSTSTLTESANSLTASTGTATETTIIVSYTYDTIPSGTGKGGLVWTKQRNGTFLHCLTDTARGVGNSLDSADTAANDYSLTRVSEFNASGFTMGGNSRTNASGSTYVSWTFRKQAKFFDIVTYTGNGVGGRNINHSLGSTPGFVLIKRTDSTGNWLAYHRYDFGSLMKLNLTDAASGADAGINVTSTTFQVFNAGANLANTNGATYVAYLFAHDAGGFGAAGTDNVISCGSFTGNGSAGQQITLGYEPQFIIIKRTDAADTWRMYDTMRGMGVGGSSVTLQPNSSNNESTDTYPYINATGFTTGTITTGTYIYIAIRRGPMKNPTSGTSVFSPQIWTGNGTNRTITSGGIPPDLFISARRTTPFTGTSSWWNKLVGQTKYLVSQQTVAEQNTSDSLNTASNAFLQDGIALGANATQSNTNYATSSTYVGWFMRRAPGFFDVVCYTGTGANRTVSHNLGVAPELMIVKARTYSGYPVDWTVYTSALGNTKYIVLNTANGELTNSTIWNNTSPTASVFSVGTSDNVNRSADTYVAYLFATVSGVSKVGSYTGSGTTKQIDCGFTGGARFVLIKRTDSGSTGDWYVWDTARGIVAANDPYLLLNSTAAEVTSTDYIDTYSAGFEISSTAPAAINANGGSFIFLAIA